jgi:hypothetical protein
LVVFAFGENNPPRFRFDEGVGFGLDLWVFGGGWLDGLFGLVVLLFGVLLLFDDLVVFFAETETDALR